MYIYIYIYVGKYLIYSATLVVFFHVLRLADGGAPEQKWHLNGLLFGKQVAECDRS